jgi:predicted DNA-binding transcriptional regulator AlpA
MPVPATASMTRAEAAAYCGLAASTLARLAARDQGPKIIKLGACRQSRVRYSKEDLDRWLAAGMPVDRRGARPASTPRGCFAPPKRGQA